jgi:hypothetical protein
VDPGIGTERGVDVVEGGDPVGALRVQRPDPVLRLGEAGPVRDDGARCVEGIGSGVDDQRARDERCGPHLAVPTVGRVAETGVDQRQAGRFGGVTG